MKQHTLTLGSKQNGREGRKITLSEILSKREKKGLRDVHRYTIQQSAKIVSDVRSSTHTASRH
jgi:hypothetical protein